MDRRTLVLATAGLVVLEAAVAVVVNLATSGDLGAWIWVVLVVVVALTAGASGWFALQGTRGARVRQKASRGGVIERSGIQAPAEAPADVDQTADDGTIRDSGIKLT